MTERLHSSNVVTFALLIQQSLIQNYQTLPKRIETVILKRSIGDIAG